MIWLNTNSWHTVLRASMIRDGTCENSNRDKERTKKKLQPFCQCITCMAETSSQFCCQYTCRTRSKLCFKAQKESVLVTEHYQGMNVKWPTWKWLFYGYFVGYSWPFCEVKFEISGFF